MVGNANELARLKGHRGPLAPPGSIPSFLLPPSLSAISEVLFNTRGSRHTNSIPFANAAAAAERLPKKIQDSCSVQNTLPPSKVRFYPKTNTILKHALQLPQMPNKAKEF